MGRAFQVLRARFHVMIAMLLIILFALNVQWHFDRMCAEVYSTGAMFRLDGVYCETSLGGMPLDELLARHERVQEQAECMAAHPDKKFLCDPRWIPASDEENG